METISLVDLAWAVCARLSVRGPSFVPQRHKWIHFRCTARGDIGRCKAHPAKGECSKLKGRWITGLYSEKHGSNKPRDDERDGQAHPDPKCSKHQSLSKDRSKDLSLARTQGYADSNFMSSPCDEKRDHAIKPHGRQQAGQDPKEARERGHQFFGQKRFLNLRLENAEAQIDLRTTCANHPL